MLQPAPWLPQQAPKEPEAKTDYLDPKLFEEVALDPETVQTLLQEKLVSFRVIQGDPSWRSGLVAVAINFLLET